MTKKVDKNSKRKLSFILKFILVIAVLLILIYVFLGVFGITGNVSRNFDELDKVGVNMKRTVNFNDLQWSGYEHSLWLHDIGEGSKKKGSARIYLPGDVDFWFTDVGEKVYVGLNPYNKNVTKLDSSENAFFSIEVLSAECTSGLRMDGNANFKRCFIPDKNGGRNKPGAGLATFKIRTENKIKVPFNREKTPFWKKNGRSIRLEKYDKVYQVYTNLGGTRFSVKTLGGEEIKNDIKIGSGVTVDRATFTVSEINPEGYIILDIGMSHGGNDEYCEDVGKLLSNVDFANECAKRYGINSKGGKCLNAGEGFHSADKNEDWQIDLSELLRVIQFFNSDGYHCDPIGEDGYNPGPGDQTCEPYNTDYNPQDWQIDLSELLRVIQIFNSGGYRIDATGEDGFGPCNYFPEAKIAYYIPGETEGESGEMNLWNNDGSILVYNLSSDGINYEWNDKTNEIISNEEFRIPIGFEPTTGYFFPNPQGYGKVNVWGKLNGELKLYILDVASNKWHDRSGIFSGDRSSHYTYRGETDLITRAVWCIDFNNNGVIDYDEACGPSRPEQGINDLPYRSKIYYYFYPITSYYYPSGNLSGIHVLGGAGENMGRGMMSFYFDFELSSWFDMTGYLSTSIHSELPGEDLNYWDYSIEPTEGLNYREIVSAYYSENDQTIRIFWNDGSLLESDVNDGVWSQSSISFEGIVPTGLYPNVSYYDNIQEKDVLWYGSEVYTREDTSTVFVRDRSYFTFRGGTGEGLTVTEAFGGELHDFGSYIDGDTYSTCGDDTGEFLKERDFLKRCCNSFDSYLDEDLNCRSGDARSEDLYLSLDVVFDSYDASNNPVFRCGATADVGTMEAKEYFVDELSGGKFTANLSKSSGNNAYNFDFPEIFITPGAECFTDGMLDYSICDLSPFYLAEFPCYSDVENIQILDSGRVLCDVDVAGACQ